MQVAAIVVAAGRGRRAGEGAPKQYRPLAGVSVLARTLQVFLSHPAVEAVQTVIGADDTDDYRAALPEGRHDALLPPVRGGATRQNSVLAGLEAVAARGAGTGAVVLIHDAARPFLDHALIDRAIAAARRDGAAVPGVMVADTINVVGEDGRVTGAPARAGLRAIQTPQAFALDLILGAHRRAAAAGLADFTDDGAVAAWAGAPVTVFEGESGNVKLTSAADFAAAERRLGAGPLICRVGTGFDVHAFGPGDHVWLGGLKLAADRGVIAHSDGDVVLHALTDALLGAISDGDIGTHFPPSDERWRGAASDQFLAHAAGLVRGRGGVIDHLDVTVLCETPRVGPHRPAMRERIAAICGIGPGSVSVKATTTEALGFVGRREGLAAQASATLRLPAGA